MRTFAVAPVLTSVDFTGCSSLTTIGEGAFYDCPLLAIIFHDSSFDYTGLVTNNSDAEFNENIDNLVVDGEDLYKNGIVSSENKIGIISDVISYNHTSRDSNNDGTKDTYELVYYNGSWKIKPSGFNVINTVNVDLANYSTSLKDFVVVLNGLNGLHGVIGSGTS